ncbi:hypothetical protein EVAR_76676_1 [Eumeta japonica]|uniref:Uncharacterized protein n=1 Tax=Eumeta variegata TaxID=151549 RepID=A0A4C1YC93_EUMVA|nr:hypothetical protein EVAR_76676_1 [Eumeta japonica]
MHSSILPAVSSMHSGRNSAVTIFYRSFGDVICDVIGDDIGWLFRWAIATLYGLPHGSFPTSSKSSFQQHPLLALMALIPDGPFRILKPALQSECVTRSAPRQVCDRLTSRQNEVSRCAVVDVQRCYLIRNVYRFEVEMASLAAFFTLLVLSVWVQTASRVRNFELITLTWCGLGLLISVLIVFMTTSGDDYLTWSPRQKANTPIRFQLKIH